MGEGLSWLTVIIFPEGRKTIPTKPILALDWRLWRLGGEGLRCVTSAPLIRAHFEFLRISLPIFRNPPLLGDTQSATTELKHLR